jgi:hypothetical protein
MTTVSTTPSKRHVYQMQKIIRYCKHSENCASLNLRQLFQNVRNIEVYCKYLAISYIKTSFCVHVVTFN